MTEQISIAELIEGSNYGRSRTLLAAVVLNAIGGNVEKDYGIVPGETKEITVNFKINGVDCSLRSYLDRLDSNLDKMIEEEAANLLRKRLKDDAYNSLENMKRMIQKAEIELFETYFPNDPEFNETRYDR